MNPEFKKPLILDGAMGTELMRRGVKLPLPLWSSFANIENYDQIINVHSDYIKSGCNIITTNTFRSTARTFIKAGYEEKDAELMCRQSFDMAISAAKQAGDNKNILIAGSIAPLEDCYEPSHFPGKEIAVKEFSVISEMMLNSGVDVLLLETMGCYDEIESVLKVNEKIKKQIWLSIVLKDKNHILDGTHIKKVIELANKYVIDMLLINCTPISIIENSLNVIIDSWTGKWGAYPNAGISMPTKDGIFTSTLDDNLFGDAIRKFVKLGASLVGSCCGSTPKTIQIINNIIQK